MNKTSRKTTVLTIALFSILLSSGIVFNSPLPSNYKSVSSHLTNNNMKNAFAQENNYYKDNDYDLGYENDNNGYYDYDKENFDYRNDKGDSSKYYDKKLKEYFKDKKVTTIDSDGNLICNIIIDNIKNSNNVTINISDISMCNIVGQNITEPPQSVSELNISKNWFVCDNEGIVDCTLKNEENQTDGFEIPSSILYTQCNDEDNTCQFVNDAGFEIIVDGNNPTPNTFDALINTIQNVELEGGSYIVSELLSSTKIIENSIIDVDDVDVGNMFDGSLSVILLAFDPDGQRVFTANGFSDSVSLIDLDNSNNVIDIDLSASGGEGPFAIVFDPDGQRVFTANIDSDSVSLIDINNPNNVIDIDLSASGGDGPQAIAFDSAGQRVFTANLNTASVSIIELDNANNVINVDIFASGGASPQAIAFDHNGQRVFTPNFNTASVSIIELDNANNVTDVDLSASGGLSPTAIAFDHNGQRVFTSNLFSNSISIIELDNCK